MILLCGREIVEKMKSDDNVMVRKTARRDVVFLKTANDCAILKRSSLDPSFCRTGAVAATKGAIVASDSVRDIFKR